MDEQLRDVLLTLTIEAYQIGYLLLSPDLVVKSGNRHVQHWLDQPLTSLIGYEVSVAFPELLGMESWLKTLHKGDAPTRLEDIFRSSDDGLGNYFDMQIIRLESGDDYLLTTVDVTHKTRQEQMLQQERNEGKLLSAELSIANERLSYLLNRLVPASIAQTMMTNRKMPAPGSEMLREATILFADMRDSTAYAEIYHPSDTLEFLNTYLSIVSEAILREEGSLVQLVGDMVMGVFNIPEEQPDHATRAIRAAIGIQDSLAAFNEKAGSKFPAVSFGVGVSTGPVVSGYLGIQQRFRYAVVGDATNVAFHLSSLAAGGHILLGQSTAELLGDEYAVIEKGDMQLKRRRKLVKVYELSVPIFRGQ